jgi:hypothetical protein
LFSIGYTSSWLLRFVSFGVMERMKCHNFQEQK